MIRLRLGFAKKDEAWFNLQRAEALNRRPHGSLYEFITASVVRQLDDRTLAKLSAEYASYPLGDATVAGALMEAERAARAARSNRALMLVAVLTLLFTVATFVTSVWLR